VDAALELDDLLADAAFEVGPPAVDDALGDARRRLAGELLAGQQANRLGESDVAALAHPLVALAAVTLDQRRGQVAGDADHAAGAERLDAGLLDRVVDGAGHLAGRHAALVDRLVMVLDAQRQRVGGAADLRRVLEREVAAGRRQLDPRPRRGRRLGAVGHRHLAALGDGAHRRRGRPLEDLRRRLALFHARFRYALNEIEEAAPRRHGGHGGFILARTARSTLSSVPSVPPW